MCFLAEVYAIAINKGGVAKTTLTTNLAGAITSKLKRKVLIIDTDGQGNSSVAFGIKNTNKIENTIYDVLMGDIPIRDTIIEITPELHIVPSNKDMNFLEFDILPHVKQYDNPFKLLSEHINKVKDLYDYIFIDTPPSLGLVTGNVLACTDKLIIPFAPETFGVNGLINMLDGVKDFKEEQNPALEIVGVVGTMIDSRTSLHSQLLQEARAYCAKKDVRMFDTVIPNSIRFANATAYDGKPATWLKSKKNDVIQAYFDLLDEILEGSHV